MPHKSKEGGVKMIYCNKKYKRMPTKQAQYNYVIQIGDADKDGNRVIKIGTTNDMLRRMKEHEQYYADKDTKTKANIYILWYKEVKSKYTTLRVEDENKEIWKKNLNYKYIRNDRFIVPKWVDKINVKIRKNYEVDLNVMCIEI